MIGRRLIVLLAAGVVACALPLAASANGTADGAPPKRWTANMCTSLVEWQKTVQRNAGSLERTLGALKKSGDINMRAVRAQFVTFLDGLAASTDGVRIGLHSVGAPAIEDGAAIQRQLEGGFGKLAGLFRGIARRARSMPLDNAAAFKRQADAIGASITKATDSLGTAMSALDRYDASAIEAAAKTVPACKALG
jgi:hypothetical protein